MSYFDDRLIGAMLLLAFAVWRLQAFAGRRIDQHVSDALDDCWDDVAALFTPGDELARRRAVRDETR